MQTESNPASPTTPLKAPDSYRERLRQHMLLRNLAPGTAYRYRYHVESFFAWLGHNRPRRVERQDVVDFLLMLLEEQELSSSSRANVLAALKFFFNQVVHRPEVVANIPWPKRERFLPYIPSTDELSALFAAVNSLHLRVMLELALACGLRVSELCALKVTDIESARGLLHIHQGKGRKDRLVPLGTAMLERLREHYRQLRRKTGYVFASVRTGEHVAPKTVQAVITQAAQAIGLEQRITPHTLRHCFATFHLEMGTDLATLQRLMGHKSLKTTLLYTHLSVKWLQTQRNPLELIRLTPIEQFSTVEPSTPALAPALAPMPVPAPASAPVRKEAQR